MSRTIDERVVEMQFDNRQFERNVQTSMSTIDRLKQSLNFKGVSQGFDNINSAARGVNLSSIGSAAETVGLKFNAMYTIADQALRNITNSAMAAGKRIISALTIDPIKTGLSEYETQIGAVQTILANTESKGTTLQDVNAALDELNTYADKTIYNFTQMTRNIGTFTAAGVDLDTSVSSIKGIANLAAVSGSTSQQASTAMYQLSQALAAGKVQLMDWNSVVNAGMGGQVFQDALKRTATQMGTNVDAMIKKYGSFRESLTKGQWLTAEVLTETLTQLSGAYTEADLIAKGYTKEQAADIVKLAETAVNAATKVKTATQLWDTLKEAAQSGWTQTWEIIIGDFEEAKSFWTTISDSIGGLINSMNEARNKLLAGALSSGWKQLLGAGISDETGFQESIRKVLGDDKKFKWKAFSITFDELIEKTGSFEKAIVHALKTGDMSSEDMTKSVTTLADKIRGMSADERKAAGITAEHVKEIEALEKGLKDGSISMDEFVKKMMRPSGRENLIESLFNTGKALMSIAKPIGDAFRDIFPAMESEQLYQYTVRLREFTEKLTLSSDKAEKVKRAFKGLFSILDIGKKVVIAIAKPLAELAGSDGIGSLADLILDAAAGLGDFFTNLNKDFDPSDISGSLSKMAATISDVIGAASEDLRSFGGVLKTVGNWIATGLGWIWDGFKEVFGWISENVSAGDIFAGLAGGGLFMAAKKFGGIFDTITESFEGLFGMFGGGNGEGLKSKLGDILDGVKDSLSSFSTGLQIGSILSIAIALGILSASLNSISKLKAKDITKALLAVGSMMGMLSLTFRSMTKSLSKFNSKGIVKSAFSLIFVASAIKILASAMEKIGKLSLKEIAKGLIGVGGGLAELSLGLKFIGKTKVSLSTSIAMLALAQSCKILGDALHKFSEMEWDEIGRGLAAMGGALAELVITLGVLSKVGGGGALLGGAGIFVTVQSLGELADALKQFGKMNWDEIKRGLVAMGGALGEVGIVTGALGRLAGVKGLFGAGSILIAVQGLGDLADALKQFGGMTWDEIAHGLVGMGGALTEVATISGTLGKLTGLSGLLGSGSILIAVQGLGDLADALKKFGEMNWDEIGKGLVAMGGALIEVGGITGATGALTSFAGLVGAGTILLVIQGLDDLANALKKFGEMNWDEIGRGLTAMGAALGEIALGGLLNTLSIIGSHSISEMAEPLGVLADSLKKWKDVTVPEGLGWKLGTLATGLMQFTFSGFGASALATAAPAVGTMADSVKKWQNVTIPEGLGDKIGSLAGGIEAFTFGLAGSGTLALAAPAIGQMADSVKKWQNVTIPEGLEAGLKQIANGIGAFSFAFMGGWSISAITKPLSDLAGSVLKWKDVTIPDGLSEDLKKLADAVGDFSFSFLGGWSMDSIVSPLKNLASAVKSWANVTIPAGLGEGLKTLASGVNSFTGIGDITTITNNIKNLVKSIASLSNIDVGSISGKFSNLGTSIVEAISRGMSQGTTVLMTTLSTILDNANAYALGKSILFHESGLTISKQLGNGILIGSASVQSATSFTMLRAKNAASGYYDTFYGIGQSLASGMAAGISANSWMVEAKARAMARAAAQAAEDELDINSPSKVFRKIAYSVPEGFADGVDKLAYLATDSTIEMAKASVSGVKDAISKVYDVLDTDLNTQPTITPVIDLSSIQNGAAAIDGLLTNKTMNVSGISASVRNGRQNDISGILAEMQKSNSNNSDVVGAIANLRGDFGMLIDAINNMKLTLDGGAVVGGLINKIDAGLGQIASHKGRGN